MDTNIIMLIVFIVTVLFFGYVIKVYFKTPTVDFDENHNEMIEKFENLEEDFKDLERTFTNKIENLKEVINKR